MEPRIGCQHSLVTGLALGHEKFFSAENSVENASIKHVDQAFGDLTAALANLGGEGQLDGFAARVAHRQNHPTDL